MKPENNEPLREYLSMVTAYIIDTRVKMYRPPFMATQSNIKNVMAKNIQETLEEMVRDGLLTIHAGINEPMYEFTPPKKTNLKTQ